MRWFIPILKNPTLTGEELTGNFISTSKAPGSTTRATSKKFIFPNTNLSWWWACQTPQVVVIMDTLWCRAGAMLKAFLRFFWIAGWKAGSRTCHQKHLSAIAISRTQANSNARSTVGTSWPKSTTPLTALRPDWVKLTRGLRPTGQKTQRQRCGGFYFSRAEGTRCTVHSPAIRARTHDRTRTYPLKVQRDIQGHLQQELMAIED